MIKHCRWGLLWALIFLLTLVIGNLWCAQVQAGALNAYVTKAITAENQWSDPFTVPAGKVVICGVDVNSNTDLTITVQIQFRDEFLVAPTTWNYDIDDWVISGTPDQVNALPEFSEWVRLRIGCKTGDYTAGNCTTRMSRGAR